MSETTNPAQRLLDIFEVLEGYANISGESMQTLWARCFRVHHSNYAGLMKGLAEVYQLIESTKTAIKSVPNIEHKLYLDSFPAIEEALAPSALYADASHLFSRMRQPNFLQGLSFCAHELKKHSTEKRLSGEVLDEIKQKLRELMDFITSSTTLEPAFRHMVLVQLTGIEQSLVDYRFRGAEAIESAVDRAIGNLCRHKDNYDRHPEVRDKLFTFMQFLAQQLPSVVGFLNSGFDLVNNVRGVLTASKQD